MECHIQTWFDERWQDSAVITCPDVSRGGVKANTFFEYTLDYAFADGGQPVSLSFPLDANLHQLPHWPAFLYDLSPQGAGRSYLLGQLGLADGPGADFALICAGAFNPIGRLRVGEAVDYYQSHIGRHDPARWYHPHTGIELNNWHDVMVALEMAPDVERLLRGNMAAFGLKLKRLVDCMRGSGVDDDITSYLSAGIDEQCRQLRELKGH